MVQLDAGIGRCCRTRKLQFWLIAPVVRPLPGDVFSSGSGNSEYLRGCLCKCFIIFHFEDNRTAYFGSIHSSNRQGKGGEIIMPGTAWIHRIDTAHPGITEYPGRSVG